VAFRYGISNPRDSYMGCWSGLHALRIIMEVCEFLMLELAAPSSSTATASRNARTCALQSLRRIGETLEDLWYGSISKCEAVGGRKFFRSALFRCYPGSHVARRKLGKIPATYSGLCCVKARVAAGCQYEPPGRLFRCQCTYSNTYNL